MTPARASDPSRPALFRWYPALAARIPHVRFTDVPTPVTHYEHVGPLRTLWVKRDDLSGRPYGGNKPRKLEFVLAEAQRRGHRSVVTFGGLGTHHGVATTVCGAALGLHTHVVLVPQPITATVQRTLRLLQGLGATLHFAPSPLRAAACGARIVVAGALRGERPAIVATGATSVLGVLGYVNAALELAEQVVNEVLPEPGTIFVPLGSGGTHVGLALGLKLAGLHTRVVGVLVTDVLPPSPARLARLGRATLRHLRRLDPRVPDVPFAAADVPQLTDHLGPGYGAASPAGDAAAAVAASLGLTLEPTYSAKAFAAVLAHGGARPYRDAPVVFWHTYSAVDPGERVARWPEPDELPPAFRRFFA